MARFVSSRGLRETFHASVRADSAANCASSSPWTQLHPLFLLHSADFGSNNTQHVWPLVAIVFVGKSLKEIQVVETQARVRSGLIDAVSNARDVAEPSTQDVTVARSVWQVSCYKPFVLINGSVNNCKRFLKAASDYALHSAADFRAKSTMRSFKPMMSETDRFREKLLSNK